MVNNITRIVSTVEISGTKVVLNLSSPVAYGDIVTVAYTKPPLNPLQTTEGGEAIDFIAQPVKNNCSPSGSHAIDLINVFPQSK